MNGETKKYNGLHISCHGVQKPIKAFQIEDDTTSLVNLGVKAFIERIKELKYTPDFLFLAACYSG